MKPTIDCLVIGHHQLEFATFVDHIRQLGEDSGAFRDIRTSFYEEAGRVVSCTDAFNREHRAADEPAFSYDNIFSATIAYLGTFLRRRGLTWDYVNSYRESRAALIEKLQTQRVHTVAVTTTYYVVALPLADIIATVRRYSPATRIIVGGPFLTTQHKIHDRASFLFTLDQLGADFYVVSSQGEQALVHIIRAVLAGASGAGIANCIYRDGGQLVANPLVTESSDLAQNQVDWSLFADAVGARGRKMAMVRTAISCPFACSFCSFPVHAGAYKYLEPSQVRDELDELDALGDVRSVTFIDDTFNVPLHRFRELLQLLKDRKYRFAWNCNLRLQHVDDETIGLMREAGCHGVFLGIESGSDTILSNMNKKSRAEAYRRGIQQLRQHGIMSYASLIVGFPGETERTVRETIDLIETARPDFFRAQLWYYDTTTPIHHQAARYQLTNSQFEWSHSTMTSQEAAWWIDHLHGAIEGSVWLPQNDFDYPSLFNLLSRGWSVDRIKAMVRTFNARVRRGLRAPAGAGNRALNQDLLASAGLEF
jgi:anaerobic magnesium-protoporphyrin IX monomethyl ester cyclase